MKKLLVVLAAITLIGACTPVEKGSQNSSASGDGSPNIISLKDQDNVYLVTASDYESKAVLACISNATQSN